MGGEDRKLIKALLSHGFDGNGNRGVGWDGSDRFKAKGSDCSPLKGVFEIEGWGGRGGCGWGGWKKVVCGEPIIVRELPRSESGIRAGMS